MEQGCQNRHTRAKHIQVPGSTGVAGNITLDKWMLCVLLVGNYWKPPLTYNKKESESYNKSFTILLKVLENGEETDSWKNDRLNYFVRTHYKVSDPLKGEA